MFDPASCALATILCVGIGEEYNTDIPEVEVAFQEAVNAAKPGDTVIIRGGTYKHKTTTSTKTFLTVANSGSASSPLVIRAADGEIVKIEGFGYAESSSSPSKTNGILVHVTGDYVQIYDLDLSYATKHSLIIDGNNGYFENLTVHDSWMANILIGYSNKEVSGNTLKYIESFRGRHGSGFLINRASGDVFSVKNTLIENSISYKNGFQPDGVKVPTIDGDPAGGGNSDGFGVSKYCQDLATSVGVDNLCPSNVLKNNAVWGNADDGYDVSMGGGSVLQGNISFNNGPQGQRGFKVLRDVKGGLSFFGNISVGEGERGFEPRFNDVGKLFHNVSVGQPMQGVILSAIAPTKVKVFNNVSMSNGSTDLSIPSGVEMKANWSSSNGEPSLVTSSFSASTISTEFPVGASILEKYEFIHSQFKTAYSPKKGSPLIDAGSFEPGYHCERADDGANPMDPNSECRHWGGAAPDIGAFEYGASSFAPVSPTLIVK